MTNKFTKTIAIALLAAAGLAKAEASNPSEMVLLVSVNATSLKNPVLLKSLADSCFYTGVVEKRNGDEGSFWDKVFRLGRDAPGVWSIAIHKKVCDQIESPVVLRASLEATVAGPEYQSGDKLLVASEI